MGAGTRRTERGHGRIDLARQEHYLYTLEEDAVCAYSTSLAVTSR